MMARTQIVLDPEVQKRAKRRANDLGISLAEYVRRLVARDLAGPDRTAEPSAVYDLGDSGGTDIAREKDRLIGAAFAVDRTTTRDKRSKGGGKARRGRGKH